MGEAMGLAANRRERLTRAARELGLLGSKGRQMGGRFPEALVEEAKRVSGIAENTDLITYALLKVALEDDFGDRLLKRKGAVPKGSLECPFHNAAGRSSRKGLVLPGVGMRT